MPVQIRQHFAAVKNDLRILRTLFLGGGITGERVSKFSLRGEDVAEFDPAFGQHRTHFHRAPERRFRPGPLSLQFQHPAKLEIREVIVRQQIVNAPPFRRRRRQIADGLKEQRKIFPQEIIIRCRSQGRLEVFRRLGNISRIHACLQFTDTGLQFFYAGRHCQLTV